MTIIIAHFSAVVLFSLHNHAYEAVAKSCVVCISRGVASIQTQNVIGRLAVARHLAFELPPSNRR